MNPSSFKDEQTRINNGIFQHQTSIPPSQKYKEKCDVEVGCKQWNPSTYAVMQYDKVAPVTVKSFTRDRIGNTELFGGAFRGYHGGDGLRYNPDGWNEIWEPKEKFAQECDRRLSEVNYNRFNCIKGLPLTWEGSWWHGSDTRQGNQLVTRCDY